MEITPDMIGGSGVTLGALFLITFIRVAIKIGRVLDRLDTGIRKHGEHLDRVSQHYTREELHQDRLEKKLDGFAGIPRQVFPDPSTPVEAR